MTENADVPVRPSDALKAKIEATLAERKAEAAAAVEASAANYEPCIVSFIDVLGFRALLDSRSASEIHNILVRLREFTAPFEPPEEFAPSEPRLMSRAFADSVSDAVVRVRVFGTEYRDGAFFHELLDLLHAQIQCVGSGVLIRAGVAIGDAHVGLHGQGPVFGPAMVRAFEIESEEAVFPRVVIDEAAYQEFCNNVHLHKEGHDVDEEIGYVDRLLRVGEDGTRFIDYLVASESEFEETPEYFQFLRVHAELVRKGLAEATKARVRRKYVWLARYHNDVINTLLAMFRDDDGAVLIFEEEWASDPVLVLEALRIAH